MVQNMTRITTPYATPISSPNRSESLVNGANGTPRSEYLNGSGGGPVSTSPPPSSNSHSYSPSKSPNGTTTGNGDHSHSSHNSSHNHQSHNSPDNSHESHSLDVSVSALMEHTTILNPTQSIILTHSFLHINLPTTTPPPTFSPSPPQHHYHHINENYNKTVQATTVTCPVSLPTTHGVKIVPYKI